MERNPILQERHFLLNGTWFCIDKKKKEERNIVSLLFYIDLNCVAVSEER
jgi:hypothetical protein